MNQATVTTPYLNSGRRAMLLATVLLIMPFAVALGLYWFEWRPASTGNYGELIQPPRPLPENGLTDLSGNALPSADLRGKWLLVLAGEGLCEAACLRQIQEMRQIQVSLNKDMGRLRRLWLSPVAASDPALPGLLARYPDLVVAELPKDERREAWRKAFDSSAYRLHLVDPQGNVMMRYPPDADAARVRKDVERLLKYSWVG
ncbi:SCO family protein [Propionivibrio sp.]|uniref:SCO family protein n=1 Tax=Propionivibrio sp. TaxID=2212460 RepID=UPI003BF1E2D7